MPKNLSNIKTIAEIQLAELAKEKEGKYFLVPHLTRIYTLIRDLASNGTVVSGVGQESTPSGAAKPWSPPAPTQQPAEKPKG